MQIGARRGIVLISRIARFGHHDMIDIRGWWNAEYLQVATIIGRIVDGDGISGRIICHGHVSTDDRNAIGIESFD